MTKAVEEGKERLITYYVNGDRRKYLNGERKPYYVRPR